MSIAQKLYEGVEGSAGGLITYMRTDGVTIADSAIETIRKVLHILLPADTPMTQTFDVDWRSVYSSR